MWGGEGFWKRAPMCMRAPGMFGELKVQSTWGPEVEGSRRGQGTWTPTAQGWAGPRLAWEAA